MQIDVARIFQGNFINTWAISVGVGEATLAIVYSSSQESNRSSDRTTADQIKTKPCWYRMRYTAKV